MIPALSITWVCAEEGGYRLKVSFLVVVVVVADGKFKSPGSSSLEALNQNKI